MYVFGTKASYGHEQHSFDFKKNEETDRELERGRRTERGKELIQGPRSEQDSENLILVI